MRRIVKWSGGVAALVLFSAVALRAGARDWIGTYLATYDDALHVREVALGEALVAHDFLLCENRVSAITVLTGAVQTERGIYMAGWAVDLAYVLGCMDAQARAQAMDALTNIWGRVSGEWHYKALDVLFYDKGEARLRRWQRYSGPAGPWHECNRGANDERGNEPLNVQWPQCKGLPMRTESPYSTVYPRRAFLRPSAVRFGGAG